MRALVAAAWSERTGDRLEAAKDGRSMLRRYNGMGVRWRM
jgi:hypothetical protein